LSTFAPLDFGENKVGADNKGPERFAHPAAWAPFVVVGEGGAGK